jgi:dipeptide/tripeptide permease
VFFFFSFSNVRFSTRVDMSVQAETSDSAPLIEKEFDHSRYAIYIVVINLGLNFALYGFQNVLSTYLACYLGLTDSAGSLTNTIAGLTYVVALLSGFVADVAWGLYKTIVVGTVLFFIANVILLVGNVVFVTTEVTLVLNIMSAFGIVFFIVGSGGTKACTSAFLGEQFGPSKQQQEKRSRFYSWYYLSIQFGSIGVSIAAPIILQQLPWGAWGLFAILGGSFVVFFPIFLFGSRGFKKRPPQGSVYRVFFAIIGCALRLNRREHRAPGSHWLDSAKREHEPVLVEEVKTVMRVLLVFAPLPFFWAVFFQVYRFFFFFFDRFWFCGFFDVLFCYKMYSVWVKQASFMNLVIGGSSSPAAVARSVVDALDQSGVSATCLQAFNTSGVGGWAIPPSTTITLNPLFDCFLIPLFASVLYPLLNRVVKFSPFRSMSFVSFVICFVARVTPLRKMAAGHIFTMGALVTAGAVELAIAANPPNTVSIWWIVPQYFLVSVAEILLRFEILFLSLFLLLNFLFFGAFFFFLWKWNFFLFFFLCSA